MTKSSAVRALAILGVLLLIGIVAVVIAAKQINSPVTLPGQASNPPATPTDIIKVGPTVIEAIRSQAKLETVSMTIVKDMSVRRVHGLLGLCTEVITYIGYYTVTAGVDLHRITPDNISVTNDGRPEIATVTVTVPTGELLHAELDQQNSHIVAQTSANWIPGCSHQVADMTVEAQQKIQAYAVQAALQKGILQMSQDKAGAELKRLLENAGYRNVTSVNSTQYPTPGPTGLPSPST